LYFSNISSTISEAKGTPPDLDAPAPKNTIGLSKFCSYASFIK